MSARGIVEEVFGRPMTREIWSANYDKALPFVMLGVELSAVLPAVFYMFRYGQRRGRGKFLDAFGGPLGSPAQRRRQATASHIAGVLAQKEEWFAGFEGETERAVLADLLLAFCVENKNRALGRDEPIQRVFPTHYLSNWIDLPDRVAHLRGVPETIVAMLVKQEEGDFLLPTPKEARTWFPLGRGIEGNILLEPFATGVRIQGNLADRGSDKFDEQAKVSVDQLLTIRLAQALGQAPDHNRSEGGPVIPNQLPIAERSAHHFSEDIRRFVRAYAGEIPRHAFVEMLEACMAVGLFTVLRAVMEVMFAWVETGTVPEKDQQLPAELFVDASGGLDADLRSVAEASFADWMRRTERFHTALMAARLLDYLVRHDRELRRVSPNSRPSARPWLDRLGAVLHLRLPEAEPLHRDLERKAIELRERLETEHPEAAMMLEDERNEPNVVLRLAKSLTLLLGPSNTRSKLTELADAILLTNRVNRLGAKRDVYRKEATMGKAIREIARSIVFSDAVLDYLVHLHALPARQASVHRPLSFKEFLDILRDRYGLCVHAAPAGLPVSHALLQRNQAILEARLRNLGLLLGVNDAESMKRLRPRFPIAER